MAFEYKPSNIGVNLLGMTLRQVESWDETLVLHAALQSRVRVQVSSIGGYLHDWTGTIERLDRSERRCFIDGHLVSFYWLIRLTSPGGDVIENPNSMRAWKAAMAKRAEEKQTTERVRSDEWYVPQAHDPLASVREVSLNDGQRKGYLGTYERDNREVLLQAKSASLAARVFRLIGSNESFWTISGAMLKGRVLWPAWHEMMSWLCKKAEELRRGMPPLGFDCTYDQERERSAWYEENGLRITDYTCPLSTRLLETYSQVDWESLFDWADGKSARALTNFMAKAWSSNEYLPSDGGDLGYEVTQSLKAEGLIEWEPIRQFTLRELAEYVSVKELRAWIVEAGSAFKSRAGCALRDHLIEIDPPFIEDRLRNRTPQRRQRMVQPPGWTWAEFQRARKLYEVMTLDLQQYQFNGMTKEGARQFLEPRASADVGAA